MTREEANLDAALKRLSASCGGLPMAVKDGRYFVPGNGHGQSPAQLRATADHHEFPGGMKGLADEERAVADAMDALAAAPVSK